MLYPILLLLYSEQIPSGEKIMEKNDSAEHNVWNECVKLDRERESCKIRGNTEKSAESDSKSKPLCVC